MPFLGIISLAINISIEIPVNLSIECQLENALATEPVQH